MSLESQLKKVDVKKLKHPSGKTYEQILHSEGLRLKSCIQNRLNLYLASYHPVMYDRTGNLKSSLTVDSVADIKVKGKTISINVIFNENAYHNSGDGIVGWKSGSNKKSNVARLLNYGYEVKKDVWFKRIKNFGYREGGNFIEDGVNDFEQNNPYGIKVQICNQYKG